VHPFQSCSLAVRADDVAEQMKQDCGHRSGQSHVWHGVVRNTNAGLRGRQTRVSTQTKREKRTRFFYTHYDTKFSCIRPRTMRCSSCPLSNSARRQFSMSDVCNFTQRHRNMVALKTMSHPVHTRDIAPSVINI
jgi:hypothetical protein